MDIVALTDGFARWPAGQDALIDAVQCAILAHWTPGTGDPAAAIRDPDIAELYRVFHELTGWTPTAQEQIAARPHT